MSEGRPSSGSHADDRGGNRIATPEISQNQKGLLFRKVASWRDDVPSRDALDSNCTEGRNFLQCWQLDKSIVLSRKAFIMKKKKKIVDVTCMGIF
jgi:hypothetical protein